MRGCVIWIALALSAVLVWAIVTDRMATAAGFLHGLADMIMPDSLDG